ncbi:hypothetical protein [Flavivirga eckloniae]|uniref:Uncharacterized protein n=1 Tax=Flavivirga eckloniae TaxID=1803846 RepID=A0A2K9PX52_9FLAO|nr:hypothetical protein [Flavivirga eckloniae]AUP81418.1 hypothetical protein C1H87_22945 [Flavivirga eckloniae]
MLGEKEQSEYTGKFDASPENGDKPNESSFWIIFNSVLKNKIPSLFNGFVKFGKNIYTANNDVIKAEAEIKKAEAKKKLAEAAKIANEAKGINIENIMKVNDSLIDIHTNEKLPDDIKKLLTIASLSNNPAILNQVQKLKDMGSVLKAVNFASINLEIKDDEAIEAYEKMVEAVEKDYIDQINATKNSINILIKELKKLPPIKNEKEVKEINSTIGEYKQHIKKIEINLQKFRGKNFRS